MTSLLRISFDFFMCFSYSLSRFQSIYMPKKWKKIPNIDVSMHLFITFCQNIPRQSKGHVPEKLPTSPTPIPYGAGGKPSTWLPPGGLVEHHMLFKISSKHYENFTQWFSDDILIISKFSKFHPKFDFLWRVWSGYLLKFSCENKLFGCHTSQYMH